MNSNLWIRKNLQSLEAKKTRNEIDDTSVYYATPATIYSGFANLTENGIQNRSALVSDFISFSKVFTGKEGLVAIIDNALKLYAKKVPNIFTREYTTEREFTEQDLFNSLTNDISFLNIKEFDDNGNEISSKNYIYNNSNFLNDDGTIKVSLKDILSYWEAQKDKISNIIEYFINVIDITKIGIVLNTNYKRQLQAPNYFKISLNDVSFGASFSNLSQQAGIGNYTNLQSARTINCSTTTELFKKDLFKFYLIPLNSGNDRSNDQEWFFISNITPYYEKATGKFIYNDVSFTSINDAIANTGQSVDQFIQTGSAGEGKLVPLVEFDDKGIPINIGLNYDLAVDTGVNTIQIEVLGPAATNGIRLFGRPLKEKGQISERVYAPRRLFAYKMKYPIANVLSQTTNPENTFYGTTARPTIDKYYEKWIEKLSANVSQNYKQRFEGFLECDTNTTKTNVGNSQNVKFNVISEGFNLKGTDTFKNHILDTKLNSFFCKTLPDNTVKGNLSFKLNDLSKIGAKEIINLGPEGFTWLEELPIDIKQTTTWFLRDIPLIGGFLNKITAGIPVGWRSEKYANNEAFPNVSKSAPCFLISASLYDWYTKSFFGLDSDGDTKIDYLPFDMFRNDTDDEVGSIIGKSASNTTFTFSLSDKIVANRFSKSKNTIVGKSNISTLYLGQDDPYNSDEFFVIGKDFEVLNPLTETKYTDIIGTENYIVDYVNYKGIAKSDIRITTFYEDPDAIKSIVPQSTQNYYVVINSTAKRINSTRSWNTDYKMSYLDEYIQDEVEFKFPQYLPIPEPIIQGVKDKEENLTNYNKTFVQKTNLDTSTYNGSDINTIILMDLRKYGIYTMEQLETYYSEIRLKCNSYASHRTRYHDRILGIWANENNFYFDATTGPSKILDPNNYKLRADKWERVFKPRELLNKVELENHFLRYRDIIPANTSLSSRANYNYKSSIYFENGLIKVDYEAKWDMYGTYYTAGFLNSYLDTTLTLKHNFENIILKGK